MAEYRDLDAALQPVARALRDRRTAIVIDNVESVLPEHSSTKSHEETRRRAEEAQAATETTTTQANDETMNRPENLSVSSCDFVDEIFSLCAELLAVTDGTRMLFTSREWLPAPFDHPQCRVTLGALSQDDAVELVSHVLRTAGLDLKHDAAGNTPQEITDLVTTAGGHARALTLLARGLAGQGARATAAELRELMARLDREHPGDRENSLYASVELSLRRLPPELREQAKLLAVFHGGANRAVIGMMLEADVETVRRLAAALVEVGLAAAMPYGHLRLDPALPSLLLARTDAAELPALTARWAEAMRALTGFLHQQYFQDTQLAAQLTLLELPNLQALLAWAAEALPPEEVVDLAGGLETLLAPLGRPQALAQAVSVRAAAAGCLGAWSHAQFQNASSNIDRLLEQGDLQPAYAAARQLLERCLTTGATAYPGADYDIAVAHFMLGRVLKKSGAAEQALAPLLESRQQFQALADAGNTSAARMASGAITEGASCLLYLGRYDEAAAAYEEAIRLDEELGDRRGVAVGKGQLGTVRLRQKRYAEALERYNEAMKTFEALGEPGSVAKTWHQIGMVHGEAGQFAQAEQAYRQSLAIKVQQKNRAGEASSLGQLGNLYKGMGRLEESATFYRQAAEIYAQLQDLRYEGFARSSLADRLIMLLCYDEARRELRRAIECNQPFGHAAEPWKTWNILYDLEQATGNAQAAAEARGQAVAAYLAYRRAGGESQSNTAPLFALVAEALRQGATAEAAAQLRELSQPDHPAWLTALLDKLQAVLGGERAASLAADPALSYADAVELQLLLE